MSTFSQALTIRQETVWSNLGSVSILDAINEYLKSVNNPQTHRAYKCQLFRIFSMYAELGWPSFGSSLQTLALSNPDNMLDYIKQHVVGTEATKQHYCATLLAFMRYLTRATNAIIRPPTPKRGGESATFRKIRDRALTHAMNQCQWSAFLRCLQRQSQRDYLIAKTILQGAKRVGEVIRAQIGQIDWEKRQIRFVQEKSRGIERYTVITYPEDFLAELRAYIGERTAGPIFTTRNGKPLSQPHLYRSFVAAGAEAGLPFAVHPHCLRATAITYLSLQGYHSDEIMRVSGHASPAAVIYYDKRSLEQNPTTEISLI
jgi:integrase/recombinase XerD